VDLSTPEGVRAVIQDVINGIQSLTEITTGIVDSFRPYALALGDIIQKTEGLGTESNKQIGNILGIAKAFENFGGAVVAIGLALGDDKNSINRFFTGFVGLSESFIEAVGVTIDYIKLFLNTVDLIELKTNAFNPFGDSAEETAVKIKQAEQNIAGLNQKIDAHWDKSAEGFRKFGNAITGSTDEASEGMGKTAAATEKAVAASKGFEPINLGDIDFVAEGMKRLGDATWLAKRYTGEYKAEVEKITLPDGATKITDSLGNITIVTAKAKTATEALNDSVKKSASEMDKAQKAADDYALKLMEASNKVKIAGMETWGKINIAQIEADTKQVESMFKSIDNTISTTGKGITDLWGQMNKTDEWNQSSLMNSIRQQEQSQKDALSKQNELIDAQIALLKARTEKMQSGDALIRVEATGLKPHLERIFGEILKETQLKASEQGVNLLLGYST
jgi:hypothetical protein